MVLAQGTPFPTKKKEDEKEKCRSSIGLLSTLNEKFKLQHNETNLSLQCCNLIRKENGSTEKEFGLDENQSK